MYNIIKVRNCYIMRSRFLPDNIYIRILGEIGNMAKNRKILRGFILTVLLICTAFLVYSIVKNPFRKHDIMLALAITVGFIALGADKF